MSVKKILVRIYEDVYSDQSGTQSPGIFVKDFDTEEELQDYMNFLKKCGKSPKILERLSS